MITLEKQQTNRFMIRIPISTSPLGTLADCKMMMAGCNCCWHHILASSMDYREERSSFHSNFHSISSSHNSYLLCVLVEGNPSLGKVLTITLPICILTFDHEIFLVQSFILIFHNHHFKIKWLKYRSVAGVVLLVAGLYSVLWGKKKEDEKMVTNEQNPGTNKEEIVLECITHQ